MLAKRRIRYGTGWKCIPIAYLHWWLERPSAPIKLNQRCKSTLAGCPSGQWEGTVNPHTFEGSNPSPATKFIRIELSFRILILLAGYDNSKTQLRNAYFVHTSALERLDP